MALIGRNELTIEKDPLATGGFGAVYRGIWKTKKNQPVAIKKLLNVDLREIETLKRLQHLNIVSFFGYVKEETDVMIVMELCELGSLKSFLDARINIPLSLDLTYDWLLHAALPIQYLRKQNIEHMDIKTDNYVITGKMVLKLTDFGLSEELESTKSYSSDAGSWRWMPPERLRDHKLSPKFDIWALALVFWCLFTRQLPYSNYKAPFVIAQAVINGERPTLPSNCPEPVANLIRSCWEDNRSNRPDIEHVIATIVHSKPAFCVESKTSETQTKAPPRKVSALTQTTAAIAHDISIQTECPSPMVSMVESDSGMSTTSSGNQPIQVHRLPPVLVEVTGYIDDFYWSVSPRSGKRISHLPQAFGRAEVKRTRGKITEVIGTIDQLKEVEKSMGETLILVTEDSSLDMSEISERGVTIESIPYVTDDSEQLKDELIEYVKQIGAELELLSCPIQGNMRRAIAVFKSTKERDLFILHGDHEFFGEPLQVEELPRVFEEVTATFDAFYMKSIPKIKMNKIKSLMQDKMGLKFTEDSRRFSGTLKQIHQAEIYFTDIFGLLQRSGQSHSAIIDRNEGSGKGKTSQDMEKEATKSSAEDSVRNASHDGMEIEASIQSKDNSPANSQGGTKVVVDVGKQGTYMTGKCKSNVYDDHLDNRNRESNARVRTTQMTTNATKSRVTKESTLSADVKRYVENANEEDRDLIEPDENNFSHPCDASNYSDHDRPMIPSSRTTAEANSNETDFLSAEVLSSGAVGPQSRFGESFIPVDQMIFKYMKVHHWSALENLQKKHCVKIKMGVSDPANPSNILVELKARRVRANSTDIFEAQEEFTQLYYNISRNTFKEIVPIDEVGNDQLKMVQENLMKKFPNVEVAWNKETECTLCGDKTTVENAAQELSNSISCYESLSVNKIVFEYLSTVNKNELDAIKKKYKITLEIQEVASKDDNQQAVYFRPYKPWKSKCSLDNLHKAKEEFISLYQVTFCGVRCIPIKCQDISESVITAAVKGTKKVYPNIHTISGRNTNEIIICAAEGEADGAIREFRTLTGLLPKRRLRRPTSENTDQTSQSSQHRADSLTTDRNKGYGQPPLLRNSQISPSVFVPAEGLFPIRRALNDEFTAQSNKVNDGQANAKPTYLPKQAFQTDEGILLVNQLGDITTQKADAMINCTDEKLKNIDGISLIISKAAGPNFQRECNKCISNVKRPLKSGDIITTKGHQLGSTNVLHITEPRSADIETSLVQILSYADKKLAARSITLPLISRSEEPSISFCARAMGQSIQRFSQVGRSVKEIHFVNADDLAFTELGNTFSSMFKPISVSVKTSASQNSHQCNTQTWSDDFPEMKQNTRQTQGAVPKKIQNQEVGHYKDDSQPQRAGYLSGFVKPVMNVFGYGGSSKTVNLPLDTTQQSPKRYSSSGVQPQSERKQSLDVKGQKHMVCNKCYEDHDVKMLEGCGHTFCTKCIIQYITPASHCLNCRALYCVVRNRITPGTMTYYTRTNLTLPGESGIGAVVVDYEFPDGTVEERGQYHGRHFKGNRFQAYLPNTSEGIETVWLLRTAFITNLTFTVKPRESGVLEVTWSDVISHKHNLKGGIANHGYPDPDYLAKVKEELKNHGIVSSLYKGF